MGTKRKLWLAGTLAVLLGYSGLLIWTSLSLPKTRLPDSVTELGPNQYLRELRITDGGRFASYDTHARLLCMDSEFNELWSADNPQICRLARPSGTALNTIRCRETDHANSIGYLSAYSLGGEFLWRTQIGTGRSGTGKVNKLGNFVGRDQTGTIYWVNKEGIITGTHLPQSTVVDLNLGPDNLTYILFDNDTLNAFNDEHKPIWSISFQQSATYQDVSGMFVIEDGVVISTLSGKLIEVDSTGRITRENDLDLGTVRGGIWNQYNGFHYLWMYESADTSNYLVQFFSALFSVSGNRDQLSLVSLDENLEVNWTYRLPTNTWSFENILIAEEDGVSYILNDSYSLIKQLNTFSE